MQGITILQDNKITVYCSVCENLLSVVIGNTFIYPKSVKVGCMPKNEPIRMGCKYPSTIVKKYFFRCPCCNNELEIQKEQIPKAQFEIINSRNEPK